MVLEQTEECYFVKCLHDLMWWNQRKLGNNDHPSLEWSVSPHRKFTSICNNAIYEKIEPDGNSPEFGIARIKDSLKFTACFYLRSATESTFIQRLSNMLKMYIMGDMHHT